MQDPGSAGTPSLAFAPLDVLQDLLPGQVHTRADPTFQNRASVFNGNVVSPALAVVVPGCANDISVILRFCTDNNLLPSVKAGGYGTAGWAIGGDIVIDLSELNDISIEPPAQDGGFRSIRDTPFVRHNRMGKGKADFPHFDVGTNKHEGSTDSLLGKRRRSNDSVQDEGLALDSKTSSSPLPRSVAIERFLQTSDILGPSLRRRLGSPSSPILQAVPEDLPSRYSSTESSTSPKASSHVGGDDSPNNIDYNATGATTPSTAATSPGATEDAKSATTRGSEHMNPVERVTESTSTYERHAPTFAIRSTDPFSYMTTAGNSGISRPTVIAFDDSPSSSLSNASVSAASRPHIFLPVHSLRTEKSAEASNNTPTDKDAEKDYGTSRSQTFLPEQAFMSSSAVPHYSRAYVTLGAGAKQVDVDIFTAEHPLPATAASGAATSIAYHIPLAAHPVGSSVLLLGGFGFLSRLHGLSIDNLVEAEVVLADGSIVIASEKKNSDLWWALRGAGPAFGIVTRYKAIAYPVPSVFAGNLIYEFHPATAASLLCHFRDVMKGVPPAVYANVLLTAGPAGRSALIVLQLCTVGGAGARSSATTTSARSNMRRPPSTGQTASAGGSNSRVTSNIGTAEPVSATASGSVGGLIEGAISPEQVNAEGPNEDGEVDYDPGQDGLGIGRALLQALLSWEGGTPLLNEVSEKSFLAQQDSVAQILRGKRGRQWFIRSALIDSLPDDVIYKTVTEFANTPVGCTWLFELAGAAVASADRSRDTCIPHRQREARFNVAAFHQWELGDDDPLCVTTAEHWIYETLAPVSVGGPLPTFLGRHERAERIEASYGEHWGRLRELKQRYDPHGLFRSTFWPLGPDGEVLDVSAREPPSP